MTEAKGSQLVYKAEFGPFRLDATRRLLERGGAAQPIGARALDILILLVHRAGTVVSNRELIEYAWPDLVVEESNVRVHIAGLRKMFGDRQEGVRYIANVTGRGYSFVHPVVLMTDETSQAGTPATTTRQTPKTIAHTYLIGREKVLLELRDELREARVVTIVGPGGMGKTAVATELTRHLKDEFAENIVFIDFASVTDPALLVGTLASALGLAVASRDIGAGLVAFLQNRKMLLVLDNCEHMIEGVAAAAHHLIVGAPRLQIVVTSREPLRIEGERLYPLPPLDSPAAELLTAEEIVKFPSVQLLLDRAAANGGDLQLDDALAQVAGEICRRLDGIALAIEIAAGRIATHGLLDTAELLGNRFSLHWRGRRTALARHQNLAGLLDWSYRLLSDVEQMVLRRLSVFIGPFNLDATYVVPGADDVPRATIVDAVNSLVNKSLLSATTTGAAVRYRLLETTRAYAKEKLSDSGEEKAAMQHHALCLLHRLRSDRKQLDADSSLRPEDVYRLHLGDARVGLRWCFAQGDDMIFAVGLAVACTRMFLELSLFTECHLWATRALAVVKSTDCCTNDEMDLLEALATSAMFSEGNSDGVYAAIARGLVLAEAAGDRARQLRFLAGKHIFLTRVADYRGALTVSKASLEIAQQQTEISEIVVSEWMVGVSHNLVGNQAIAIEHLRAGFDLAVARPAAVRHFGYDHRIRARIAFARSLWINGQPDQAAQFARHTVEEVDNLSQPVNVCIVFIYSIPVFMWRGEWKVAHQITRRLEEYAGRHSLKPYQAVAAAFDGELLLRTGNPEGGAEKLRKALSMLATERHAILSPVFAAALAQAHACIGRPDEALTIVEKAIGNVNSIEEDYYAAELFRVKAEILAMLPNGYERAENALQSSLAYARRQQAKGWELRSAVTLGRLWLTRDRAPAAKAMLTEVLDHFSEGFDTLDLKIATALLASANEAN